MEPMKFGVAFANIGPFVDPAEAVRLAQAAECAGFESIWTVDHVVVPGGYRSTYPYDPSGRLPSGEGTVFPDPLIWLAYVAARTSTLGWAPASSSCPSAIRWCWPRNWPRWTTSRTAG